jgi:hypothetical protein
MKSYLIIFTLCSLGLLASCTEKLELMPLQETAVNNEHKLKKYSNQVILDWNLVALEAMGGPTYPLPLVNSRINAMMHIAMHDALNNAMPVYETYAYEGKDPSADPIAAAASAAYEVLVVEFPDQQMMLQGRLAESLSEVKDNHRKKAGIALGKAAAGAILALRAKDGAYEDPIGTVAPSTTPGVYQMVPPFNFVYAEFWKDMQPFALDNPEQFRSKPYPALSSQQYALDFDEVKKIGQLNSPYRTADETFVAKFWYELSEMGWNKIARIVAEEQNLDLMATARLFALLDIATADAYIAGFNTRFYYNFWRPYTAIRAENDGNDLTERDATWLPAELTPPVPDYPSTHSALGNAAATVLAHILGDQISFTFLSTTAVPADQSRSFTSFSQAANENANSRVWAGIHFRSACNAGQTLGNEVGAWVIANKLKPRKYPAQGKR